MLARTNSTASHLKDGFVLLIGQHLLALALSQLSLQREHLGHVCACLLMRVVPLSCLVIIVTAVNETGCEQL